MARSDVITTARRIRRQLGIGYRLEQMVLLTGINSSDITLTMTTTMPAGVTEGVLLGVGTEMMLVVSANHSANTVTVIRAFQDTTAAAHVAGSLIDISPRFSLVDIVEAMRGEMMAWGSQLYYPVSETFTVSPEQQTLELPLAWVNMLGLLNVIQSDVSGDITTWPRVACKFIRGDAATFDGASTSGLLLRFTEPIRSGLVYAVAAMPYGYLTMNDDDDLTDDLYLTPGMIDLLEFGAKRRVMADELSGRLARHAQDEARRAEETPLGSLVPVSQLQMMQYNRRMQDEIRLLRSRYPLRMV